MTGMTSWSCLDAATGRRSDAPGVEAGLRAGRDVRHDTATGRRSDARGADTGLRAGRDVRYRYSHVQTVRRAVALMHDCAWVGMCAREEVGIRNPESQSAAIPPCSHMWQK